VFCLIFAAKKITNTYYDALQTRLSSRLKPKLQKTSFLVA